MLALDNNNRVLVGTGLPVDNFPYMLRSMVRLIGMSMAHTNMSADDRDMVAQACWLLEEMLPSEGQLIIEGTDNDAAPQGEVPRAV